MSTWVVEEISREGREDGLEGEREEEVTLVVVGAVEGEVSEEEEEGRGSGGGIAAE